MQPQSIPAPCPRRPLSFHLGNSHITNLFHEWQGDERLQVAAAAGFTHVDGDLPSNPSEFRRKLDRYGLKFSTVGFGRDTPETGALGDAALPERRVEFRAALRRAIETAGELGCTMVHPLAGKLPVAALASAYRDTYLENVAHACDVARDARITILLEPVCALRQPQYFLNRYDQALEIWSLLDRSNLKLMLDTFHINANGEPVLDIVRHSSASMGVLQLAGPPARQEPGYGDFDFEALFDTVEEIGWQGPIAAEYVPSGATLDSLAWGRRFGLKTS
jgi:hydroxypyruvate isomerase